MNELPLNQILCGDCREILASLPEDSIDLVVTSPPYWGLRDFKCPPRVWGGDPSCEHEWGYGKHKFNYQGGITEYLGQFSDKRTHFESETEFCGKCGAWKGNLGLEPHPQLFIDNLVLASREIKRVLVSSGSFWLNLGDTFCTGKGKSYSPGGDIKRGKEKVQPASSPNRTVKLDGKWLQPKQLLGIPWRVAIALQNDGWILRNCVVWYKRNHMPESVQDRLTKSYEFFFFFVKQRKYYFDLDAIREPYAESSIQRLTQPTIMQQMGGEKQEALYGGAPGHGNRPADILKGLSKKLKHDLAVERDDRSYEDSPHRNANHPNGKNPGDMWDIPTQPFPGAHFAVFPLALIEPIIKSSCPKNGVVLDPFTGSGTALRVARKLGRSFIGIELNPDYAEMARQRVRSDNYQEPPEGVPTLTEAFEDAH